MRWPVPPQLRASRWDGTPSAMIRGRTSDVRWRSHLEDWSCPSRRRRHLAQCVVSHTDVLHGGRLLLTDGTFGVALSTSTMGSQWSSPAVAPEPTGSVARYLHDTWRLHRRRDQGSNIGRSEFRGAAQHPDYRRRRIDLDSKRLACGRTYRCSELQGLGVLDPDALLSRR